MVEHLQKKVEQLETFLQNYERKINQLENKEILDELKVKENIRYIADEIILRIDRYLKARENEQDSTVQE